MNRRTFTDDKVETHENEVPMVREPLQTIPRSEETTGGSIEDGRLLTHRRELNVAALENGKKDYIFVLCGRNIY